MRLEAPLDDILGSRSSVRLLRALFALPAETAVSGRELARRAGVAHPGEIGVLEGLADQGVVHATRALPANLYRLNREHRVVQALAPLFEIESELREELFSLLRKRLSGVEVTAAIVFGSAARDDMTPMSDLDVWILAPQASENLERLVDELADEVRSRYGTRVEARILDMNERQFQTAARRKGGIWRRIRDEGVPVIGEIGGGASG